MTAKPEYGAGLSPAPRAAPVKLPMTRAAKWARRMMFLVHRWLGIALALLMSIWAISGITMMYVAFPETTAEERVAGLQPLDLTDCCDSAMLPGGVEIQSATVEMVAGRPAVRWKGEDGAGLASLNSNALPQVTPDVAGTIAEEYLKRTSGKVETARVEEIDRDQWTVYGQFRKHKPLYKASFADDRGTVLYVSGLTGEVVQDTSAHERFWNWIGAVPHWLYFTALREIQPLWYNLVVYASALGVLLSVTGIYVGIITWRKGKRWSPFRGIALWHHWTGLVFGIVTLTWVLSGLFSMNPWGWFESEGPGEIVTNLEGRPLENADVEMLYRSLAAHPQPGVVSAEVVMQQSAPWAILVRADGSRMRYSLPDLVPAPLNPEALAETARTAIPASPVASAQLITAPDSYHYSHKNEALVLPAYRVIFADSNATRLYLDPRTGEMIGFFDAKLRAYRWWHYGLHRMDFFPALRARPVWDLVTVPLLIGVSLLCVLGTWMGIRRLRRPAAGVKRGGGG